MAAEDTKLAEIDAVYEETEDFAAVYKSLKEGLEEDESRKENVEWIWRLARVTYNLHTDETGAELKKDLANEAVGYATKALELDEGHYASHKWYAISLSAAGTFKGTTEKIQDSFVIREHADKADELNPNDASTLHLIGRWCFTFADMGMATRAIAATVYASPPTSTYQEALEYFEKADAASDFPFGLNCVWAGKASAKLKKTDEAKAWYEKALAIEVKNNADQDVHDQAEAGIAALSSWW